MANSLSSECKAILRSQVTLGAAKCPSTDQEVSRGHFYMVQVEEVSGPGPIPRSDQGSPEITGGL